MAATSQDWSTYATSRDSRYIPVDSAGTEERASSNEISVGCDNCVKGAAYVFSLALQTEKVTLELKQLSASICPFTVHHIM